MKTKLFFAAVAAAFFIVVISQCGASQADLGNFESLNIDKNVLDSLTRNRLSNYEETSDILYLFGGIPLRASGRTSSIAPVSIEKSTHLFENADTLKTIFDPNSLTLILEPEITCEVESKFLGLYRCKKTTIRGIELNRLSREEAAAIILKLEK